MADKKSINHQPSTINAGGPRSLGDALSRLMALRGYGRVQGDRQLHELWREVAGPKIADQTRPQGLRNGVLTIGVTSAGLLSELAAFHKHALLESLQRAKPALKIRDLKFRLRGRLSDEDADGGKLSDEHTDESLRLE